MTTTWYKINKFNFYDVEIDELEVEKETDKFVYVKTPRGSVRHKRDAHHFAIRKTRVECLQWLRGVRRFTLDRAEEALTKASDDLEQVELALEYELRSQGGEPEMFVS